MPTYKKDKANLGSISTECLEGLEINLVHTPNYWAAKVSSNSTCIGDKFLNPCQILH